MWSFMNLELAGHVPRILERRCAYMYSVGKVEGKNHSNDLGVEGRIILKLIFNKWDVWAWTGLM